MKKFDNIWDAVQYHKYCYICGEKLLMHVGVEGKQYPVFVEKIDINLTAWVDSSTNDILTIDTCNNQVEFASYFRQSGETETGVLPSDYPRILFEGIVCKCECSRFIYAISLQIDMKQLKLTHVGLDSETIVHNSCEIKNIYTSDKTEVFGSDANCYSARPFITLPLIPINFQNPDETIARIKKLMSLI